MQSQASPPRYDTASSRAGFRLAKQDRPMESKICPLVKAPIGRSSIAALNVSRRGRCATAKACTRLALSLIQQPLSPGQMKNQTAGHGVPGGDANLPIV
jgi:hypothetical protein